MIINEKKERIEVFDLIKIGEDNEIQKVQNAHKKIIEIVKKNNLEGDVDITVRVPEKDDIERFGIDNLNGYHIVQIYFVIKTEK